MIGEESAALPVLMSPARIAIRSGQPDREHAVLEVVGAPGLESVDELRQRALGDLFAIYRAFALAAGRWDGAHA